MNLRFFYKSIVYVNKRKRKANFSICILKDAEWSKTYVFHERKTTLVLKENT